MTSGGMSCPPNQPPAIPRGKTERIVRMILSRNPPPMPRTVNRKVGVALISPRNA
jgi:hypothetical protein